VNRDEVLAHLTPLEEDNSGGFCIRCRALRVLIRVRNAVAPITVGFRDGMRFHASENGLVLDPGKSGKNRRVVPWNEIACIAVGEPETTDGHLFQG